MERVNLTEGSAGASSKPAWGMAEWVVAGFALYLCWLLARPFLTAITWALALAVAGLPLERKLERWLRPSLAAFTSVLIIGLILLVPGFSMVAEVLHEAGDSLRAVIQTLDPAQPQAAAKYPLVRDVLDWLGTRFDLNQELKRAAGALATQVPAAVRGSAQFVTQFSIMLVVLFYFLRDRSRILEYMGGLVPLSPEETARVFERISETIRAVLYGNVAVKLVQGLLGGLMFWFLGLPAPVFFGAAMAVFAMLPIVGTSFIWGPAAIFLLIHGDWVRALVLALWGTLVVSLIDNILYPILVATEIRLHTLGILLAVLGGLVTFGIAGVVLGPVILAGVVALLEVWRMRTDPEPLR